MTNKQYYTFAELVRLEEFRGLFSVSALREYRKENTKGFNRCVYKVKGKLLININEFRDWIEGQRVQKRELPSIIINKTEE